MSDEGTFGPEFHRMSFADAIEQRILVDYKIVVVGVSDREVKKHIEQRTYLEDASADQVATSLALAKVMKKHGLAHALTFHSRVNRAKSFAALHKKRTRKTEVEHVNGSMSTNDRLVLLDEFREAPHAVMTNARCLTEGVDVPAIDCVAFVDPKHSKIDIVQAAGRALRLGGEDKDYGVILIPVFYAVGEDPEEIASTGVFKNVFEVVRAMADQDQRLQAEITNLRVGEGKRGKSQERVRFVGERILLAGFEKRLKASLVERIVARTADSWEVRFEELRRFKREYGHCDVPRSHLLGNWVHMQRSTYVKGTITPERAAKLEALGFAWNQVEEDWEQQYTALQAYEEKHGHTNVPQGNSSLGVWVAGQRAKYRKGKLSPTQIDKLQGIGFVWDPYRSAWEENYAELKAFAKENGHAQVPYSPGGLGSWLYVQRAAHNRGSLSRRRTNLLEEVGVVWEPDSDRWNTHLAELRAFKKANGHCNVPKESSLGSWVGGQRQSYAKGKLDQDRIEALEKLGFVWNTHQASWDEKYEELRVFVEENGHALVHIDTDLGKWLNKRCCKYRQGKLSQEETQKLEAQGVIWDRRDVRWEENYQQLVQFEKEHGHTLVPRSHPLGQWVLTQRHRKATLSQERINKMDAIGFIWDASEYAGRGRHRP
jgi:hypothetical protein